ncbi:MAG: hypothetical protein K2M17_01705, partial [Bacilli bacterium]|nr:hypothetical protein [Bacilli bacterium]
MKKNYINLIGGLLLLLVLFGNLTNVKASISMPTTTTEAEKYCDPEVTHADGRVSKSCRLVLIVSDSASTYNKIPIQLTLTNLTLDSVTAASNWYITSSSGNEYVFETTKTSLEVGTHTLGTVTVYKINTAQNCLLTYGMHAPEKVNRSCTTFQGIHYGLNGNPTNESTYYDECFSCKEINGTYYGKDGKPTTETTYYKDCFSCQIKDGKYYGLDGKQTTETTY